MISRRSGRQHTAGRDSASRRCAARYYWVGRCDSAVNSVSGPRCFCRSLDSVDGARTGPVVIRQRIQQLGAGNFQSYLTARVE